MSRKEVVRKKRATKTRRKLDNLKQARLTVDRSNKNTRVQLIEVLANNQHRVVVSASSLESVVAAEKLNKTEQAQAVGKLIAERAIAAGWKKVAFDRSGFKFHGRVAALAEAAREAGLEF